MRQRWQLALVLLLLLLGVLFRIWATGYARFTQDESYFWATARNIATFQVAPVYGPSMTGSTAHHPGPLFYYLMAIPQLFGSSPKLGSVFVALLHGLAAWFLFLLAWRAINLRTGILALLFWLCAPWDVLYADRIWLSCVAPVWGTVLIYAGLRASDSTAWQGGLLFLALLCPQLHMSAPIAWTVCALLLITRPPKRISRRALLLGAALAVLAYLPAIYWELTHQLTNTIAILTKGGGQAKLMGILSVPPRVFGYAVLYGSSEIGYHFAEGYWHPFGEIDLYGSLSGWSAWFKQHGLWSIANLVSMGLAFCAWGWAVGTTVQQLRSGRDRLLGPQRLVVALLGGLLVACLLLMLSRKSYYPHYTNLLMPLLLLPLALFVDRVLRSRWRGVVCIACFISILAMASSNIRYYRAIDARNGLDTTMSMVESIVLREAQPIRLLFDGFDNTYAWRQLAKIRHQQPLITDDQAAVDYRVLNRAPFTGKLPEGGERFGVVLLVRKPLRQKQ